MAMEKCPKCNAEYDGELNKVCPECGEEVVEEIAEVQETVSEETAEVAENAEVTEEAVITIDKVVAVMPDGSVGSPCGACREYMAQLDKESGEIEILLDLEGRKTIRLKELIPDWWGSDRFSK